MNIYKFIGEHALGIALIIALLFLIWRLVISPRLELDEEEDYQPT